MQRFSRLFLFSGVFMVSSAAAQAPAAAPAPCATPAHRQFDFWFGECDVHKRDGNKALQIRVERILEACVIFENWTGATGFAGKSFNLYNATTGRWEQFWVDQSGVRLHLQGGLEGERMVLAGTREKTEPSTGPAQRERISWTPNADGSVRQLWETSKDDGQTWTTSFDGLYRRAGK